MSLKQLCWRLPDINGLDTEEVPRPAFNWIYGYDEPRAYRSNQGSCIQQCGFAAFIHTAEGFVANFCVGRFGRQESSMSVQLGSKAEQATNEECLTDRIAFCQPPHWSLPDHVHFFDSLQSPPRALERTVALGKPNSFLHCPVVLFNYIAEIFALA